MKAKIIKSRATSKYTEENLLEALRPEFLKEKSNFFSGIKKVLGISEKLTNEDLKRFRELNETLLWLIPMLYNKKIITDKSIITLIADYSSMLESILKYDNAVSNPAVIATVKSQMSVLDYFLNYITIIVIAINGKPETSLRDTVEAIDAKNIVSETRAVISSLENVVKEALENNEQFAKILLKNVEKLEEEFGATIIIGGVIVSSALLFKVLRWYYVEKWKPAPLKSETILDGQNIRASFLNSSKDSWNKLKNLLKLTSKDVIAKSDLEVKTVIKQAEKTESGSSLL